MKPMHMVKSVTEQELIAVQNRYQDVVKKIEELEKVKKEIDIFFDKMDLGQILLRSAA
jgi:hypothetical protein